MPKMPHVVSSEKSPAVPYSRVIYCALKSVRVRPDTNTLRRFDHDRSPGTVIKNVISTHR